MPSFVAPPRGVELGQARPGPMAITLATPRLWLRPWREADREPFAAMNADPEVMRHFPAPLSREASDRSIGTFQAEHELQGWGRWAVEVKDGGAFIGFIGLCVPQRALPFMPCVELGYRLARAHWGRGYATEGTQAALAFGFASLALPRDEIVAFTAALNTPSQAVMRRLGMVTDTADDFQHPALPAGSALRHHVLYRIHRQRWADLHGAA